MAPIRKNPNDLQSDLSGISNSRILGDIKELFTGFIPSDATLRQNKYDFHYRIFPSDLASGDSHDRHYMVININVPLPTQFNDHLTFKGQSINTFHKEPGDELSKVDALRFNIDPQYKNASGIAFGNRAQFSRRTRRIVESIAIASPSTLLFQNEHEYTDISLTGILTGISTIPLAPEIKYQLSPAVEVLYSNTLQREFIFDFLLAPRNARDSEAMHQIYKTLRFHAAPERQPYEGGGGGISGVIKTGFVITPSEFDITFYYNGKENLSIPRINTCVLRNISMDYSPNGIYSTFSNGHPVQARLSLMFREVEVVDKLRVIQGF
jgi:hypothetical protein